MKIIHTNLQNFIDILQKITMVSQDRKLRNPLSSLPAYKE